VAQSSKAEVIPSLEGTLNTIPIKFLLCLRWQHFSEKLTVLFGGLIKSFGSIGEEHDG
jgi:hypothetical protein